MFENLNLFFPISTLNILDFIQIILLFAIFYIITKGLKQTRAWIITKGIFIVLILYFVIKVCSLTAVANLFEKISSLAAIAIVFMFQPELRKFLEKIGKNNIANNIFLLKKKKQPENVWFNEKSVSETIKAVFEMSKTKTGALIVFERTILLDDWAKTGINLNSNISWQLYVNIFEKNTPLHDGAVIVKENKIASATCYLPLSESMYIDKKMGTRHRAGIGITECTDSFVIIVSEETGKVSFVENGKIHYDIDQGKLSELLYKARKKQEEVDIKKQLKKKQKTPFFKNSNNAIKVSSIILAVFVWFFTINAEDEVTTKTYTNIPVTIQNTNIIEETGYDYTIESGETIDITIEARRSIIEQLTTTDFVAIANFKEMSITNAVPINIEIKDNYKEYVDIKKLSTTTMVLSLENTVTKEIPIEINLVGVEKEGYKAIIEDDYQDTIRVSGPNSLVSVLDKAKIEINVENKFENFTTLQNFSLYDRNGTKITNDKLDISNPSIEIKVNVYEIQYVPIHVVDVECPDNAICETIEINLSIDKVPIVGNKEIIDKIDSIKIDGIANNILTIDWSYKLPKDVYSAIEDTMLTIETKCNIYEYTTYTLPTSSINVLGLKEKEKVVFNNEYFSFNVYINKEIWQNFDPQNLDATIDVSEIIGESKVTVKFRETDGVIFSSIPEIELTKSTTTRKEITKR